MFTAVGSLRRCCLPRAPAAGSLLLPRGTDAAADSATCAADVQCRRYASSASSPSQPQDQPSTSSGAVSSAAASGSAAQVTLTPEQARRISHFLSLLHRPLNTAIRGAALVGQAAAYRDTYVAMDSLYRRTQRGAREPLLDVQPIRRKDAAAAAAAAAAASAASSSSSSSAASFSSSPLYPVLDVTQLPDSVWLNQKSRDRGDRLDLDEELMDKITCWAQTLPSHVEMSYALLTGIHLFPPTEAVYTTYVDFDAALRHLARYESPQKMRELTNRSKRQDKYQLSSWEPYTGRA